MKLAKIPRLHHQSGLQYNTPERIIICWKYGEGKLPAIPDDYTIFDFERRVDARDIQF